MTNYERWLKLTEDAVSPNSYIEFSWFWMIGAALQRRRWIGGDHAGIYPNQYLILVGDPGVGKGVILDHVSDLMKHHRVEQAGVAQDDRGYLFPIAPNTTTFEDIVRKVARATQKIVYVRDGKNETYTHCSIAFILEEAASLFREEQKQIVRFLLEAWDAKDFHYSTKTQGEDKIKRCCASIIAGTNPAFMYDAFGNGVLTEGFGARGVFLFEEKNRYRRLFRPQRTAEQETVRQELLHHLLTLSKKFGACRYTPEAEQFLVEWWEKFVPGNTNHRLKDYYSKKNMHAQKMALAVHFSESACDGIITLDNCKQALALLDRAELNMHMALVGSKENKLAPAMEKILKHLKGHGACSFIDLLAEFFVDIPTGEQGLMEIMKMLADVNKVKQFSESGQVMYELA